MVRRILIVLLVLLPSLMILTEVRAVPNGCETPNAEFGDPNWFMRYEFPSRRIVLVDYSSGEIVHILESDVPVHLAYFRSWSPNCRYMVGAIGDGLSFTTIIWDVTDGSRVGTVENGYRAAHQVTWSPRSDQVVVETRRGAFLWTLATGERIQLTGDSYLSESFIEILWDYDEGVIETRTLISSYIHFDIATGALVDTSNGSVDLGEDQVLGAFGRVITPPNAAQPYGCTGRSFPNLAIEFGANRLSLFDYDTYQIVHVIAPDLRDLPVAASTSRLVFDTCEYLFTLHFTNANRAIPRTGIVWRVNDGARAHVIEGIPARRWIGYEALPRYELDTSRRYLFVQTYNGAQIWDSHTGRVILLSTAEESARNGYSVGYPVWDIANGRVTVEMLYIDETRTFDLNTGERIG